MLNCTQTELLEGKGIGHFYQDTKIVDVLSNIQARPISESISLFIPCFSCTVFLSGVITRSTSSHKSSLLLQKSSFLLYTLPCPLLFAKHLALSKCSSVDLHYGNFRNPRNTFPRVSIFSYAAFLTQARLILLKIGNQCLGCPFEHQKITLFMRKEEGDDTIYRKKRLRLNTDPDISYKMRRIKKLILQGTCNSHTQKRRHRTSIRREREFETVYSTEGVSGQGRRRLIPQNDKILSSYTTCLENRYSVTIIQSATVIDNNATFVTEQQDSCLTTRL